MPTNINRQIKIPRHSFQVTSNHYTHSSVCLTFLLQRRNDISTLAISLRIHSVLLKPPHSQTWVVELL